MALPQSSHRLLPEKDSPAAIDVWQTYSGLYVVDLYGWHSRYDRFTCCRSIAQQYINERERLRIEYEARHRVKAVAEKVSSLKPAKAKDGGVTASVRKFLLWWLAIALLLCLLLRGIIFWLS